MDKTIENKQEIKIYSNELYRIISPIISNARKRAALFLYTETTLMYWRIGKHINNELKENNKTAYGKKILATLSQELTENFGKGFTFITLNKDFN